MKIETPVKPAPISSEDDQGPLDTRRVKDRAKKLRVKTNVHAGVPPGEPDLG